MQYLPHYLLESLETSRHPVLVVDKQLRFSQIEHKVTRAIGQVFSPSHRAALKPYLCCTSLFEHDSSKLKLLRVTLPFCCHYQHQPWLHMDVKDLFRQLVGPHNGV